MALALAIKTRTAPVHRIAEQAVTSIDPFASRDAYAAYLSKLHAFYSAIEPVLFERLAKLLPDAGARQKLALIEMDLRFLEGACVAERQQRQRYAPDHVPIPRIRTDADAMGVAYVLEGKTLGSRFLLEDARTKLALDGGAGRGAAFFAGYGARTGTMWKTYRDALEDFALRDGQRRAILNAAEATFASFTQWIAARAHDEVMAASEYMQQTA